MFGGPIVINRLSKTSTFQNEILVNTLRKNIDVLKYLFKLLRARNNFTKIFSGENDTVFFVFLGFHISLSNSGS